jgi:hypothetical protein
MYTIPAATCRTLNHVSATIDLDALSDRQKTFIVEGLRYGIFSCGDSWSPTTVTKQIVSHALLTDPEAVYFGTFNNNPVWQHIPEDSNLWEVIRGVLSLHKLSHADIDTERMETLFHYFKNPPGQFICAERVGYREGFTVPDRNLQEMPAGVRELQDLTHSMMIFSKQFDLVSRKKKIGLQQSSKNILDLADGIESGDMHAYTINQALSRDRYDAMHIRHNNTVMRNVGAGFIWK